MIKTLIPIAVIWISSFVSEIASAACYASLPQSTFPNCVLIAPNYALHWAVNSSVIVFGVSVDVPSNQNYWVGLGISQMGGMYGADVWMLLKNATTGAYYMQDSFATNPSTPTIDPEQDVILLTPPPPSNVSTVFTFMRPIRTCDPMDYDIAVGEPQHMIFAYGQSTLALSYHGPNDRGNTVLTLYPSPLTSNAGIQRQKALSEIKSLQANSSLHTMTAQFPNVTVPAVLTSYMCTHFEVPADQKYQVVQYEGVVTTDVVHHMIMYGCSQPPPAFGDVYDCESMQATCSQFTLAWVPGAGTTVFPPQAGFAIGTGVNAIRYFSLQIHYNNPDLLSNVTDNSGMRLYYTNVLRPNDIGVLTLGSQEINIPGNSPNYTFTPWNVCPSSCTNQFPGNLTVLRNGYQGLSPPIDSNAVIMPGDTLLTQCSYLPTVGLRSSVTQFGESTINEMCFNFVQYYPAMPNMGVCVDYSAKQYATCSTQANLQTLNSSNIASALTNK
ncbi:hypothetical protein HDU98_000914 [Podochytrium sp. JEL0797]|nr:hypothetical protein HDU98_000914 [Podochytrium sp. JEL0797]